MESVVDTYHSYGLRSTQAIEAYLRSLLSFSLVVASFEIFHYQKFGMERYVVTISDTDLDSLLPFKWNWMRLTPLSGYKIYRMLLITTLTFGF